MTASAYHTKMAPFTGVQAAYSGLASLYEFNSTYGLFGKLRNLFGRSQDTVPEAPPLDLPQERSTTISDFSAREPSQERPPMTPSQEIPAPAADVAHSAADVAHSAADVPHPAAVEPLSAAIRIGGSFVPGNIVEVAIAVMFLLDALIISLYATLSSEPVTIYAMEFVYPMFIIIVAIYLGYNTLFAPHYSLMGFVAVKVLRILYIVAGEPLPLLQAVSASA